MTHDFVRFPELTNAQMDLYYFESPHKQIFADFRAKVVKVTDADTIRVETSFRDFDFPVRFLDINAPELSEEKGHSVRDWLVSRLENQEVDVRINPKNRVDKWGRLLGHIFHRGMDAGQEMRHLGLVTKFEARNEGKIPNVKQELSTKKWF